jgi:hypothetical protein
VKSHREKCAQSKIVTSVDLEQRHVIQFLSRKGLKLDWIAAELSGTHGQDASERASITYWLHQLKLGRTGLKTRHVGGDPG